jgi:hypothetical protein
MKRLVLTLVLIFSFAPAHGQSVTAVRVYGASYHINRAVDFNETNPGLELELNGAWKVGGYENSYSNTLGNPTRLSVYASRHASYSPLSFIEFGLSYGLIFGYGNFIGRNIYTPLPFASPSMSVKMGQIQVNANVVGPAFGFSLTYNLQ